MPLFYSDALRDDGTRVHGTIEAISAQAARAALRKDNMEAEELHEATLQERQKIEGYTPATTPIAAEPTETVKTPTSAPSKSVAPKVNKSYYPIIHTLRLYAGWLLAWYCLVYAIGSYQYTKETPVRVPYVEALLPPFSSIVFTFTIVAFLFLLLTTLYVKTSRTTGRAVSMWALGIACYALYRINV